MKGSINLIRSVTLAVLLNVSAVVLIFNANGGSVVPEIHLASPTSTFEMPEHPVREGYVFDGWYYVSDEETSEIVDFDENFDMTQMNASEDEIVVNIYAKWIEEERIVMALPPQILPSEVYYTSIFIELDEEATPLADALPQTSQMPLAFYYGIGGILSVVGMRFKKK